MCAARAPAADARPSRHAGRSTAPSAGFAGAILVLGGGRGGATPKALRRPPEGGRSPPPGSEAADQALDPFVVGLERVLAEDGLALGVVELEVDPIHAVVLALEVRLADELTAQAGARGLRRLVLGALDGLVVGDAVDHVLGGQLVVHAAIRANVV